MTSEIRSGLGEVMITLKLRRCDLLNLEEILPIISS